MEIVVREKRCENCHWWEEKSASVNKGECHRSSPKWDGRMPTNIDYPAKNEFSGWLGESAIFPQTDKDNFCGEWR